MRIALFLEEGGLFGIFVGPNVPDLDPAQVQGRGMPAPLEAHQVGCGEPELAVYHLHEAFLLRLADTSKG